jgi:hypothetical protein
VHPEPKPITYLAKAPDERALRAELAEAITALDARDETFRASMLSCLTLVNRPPRRPTLSSYATLA